MASTPAEIRLRPTHLVVNLDSLAHNVQELRSRIGAARILAVLKANAYGHGLIPVARLFEHLGVAQLGVAYLEEGLALRRAGIRCPILVMGGIVGEQIPTFIEYDLTLTASSVPKLLAIDDSAAQLGRRARVHLKIDTGMERIGVHWYSSRELLETSLRCSWVDVEGIYSHLANADADDLSHARTQIARFEEVLDFYARRGLKAPLRHLANSSAVLRLPEAGYDLVRPGLLLYGYDHAGHSPRGLRPALTWKSRVVYFKVVGAGNPVSYGSTWAPRRQTRLITLPVGYGDGYTRRMSGKAEVLIRGRRYPVVGRICMDQVMVDIGWETAYNGDDVVLLGEQGEQRITLADLASWSETIPYEVLTTINNRVPRSFIGQYASAIPIDPPKAD